MKRKIITIDEEKCNGCGVCITACAEGALQLVNGKAHLVKEQFCDGFGDCLGACPTGALKIVEKDVAAYNEQATRQHGGVTTVLRMDEAGRKHARPSLGGCPGMAVRFKPSSETACSMSSVSTGPGRVIPSELTQWPVQLHLVPPDAPFFRDRELVLMSTCAPLASADVHWRFLRGRSVVVACPKLDRTEGYVEKLTAILSDPTIPKILIVRMEVPCCGGLTAMARRAAAETGRTNLVVEEAIVGCDGEMAMS